MNDWLPRFLGTSRFRVGALVLGAVLVFLFVYFRGESPPDSLDAPLPSPAREIAESSVEVPAVSFPERAARVRAVEPTAVVAEGSDGSGRIYGTVVMSGGVAVPEGMAVALHRYDAESSVVVYDDTLFATVTPDGEGGFNFSDVPLGSFVVYATGPGYTMQTTATLTEQRREREVTLRVVAGGSASGRVVNEALEPVEGARVFIAAWDIAGQNTNAHLSRALTSQVVTDEAGFFEMHDLRTGAPGERGYRLSVKAEGYAMYVSDYVRAGTEDAEFVLSAGGMVVGQVVHLRSGEPAREMVVALKSDFVMENLSATSDDEGWFFLTGVPAGSHGLRLVDEEYVVASDGLSIDVSEGEQTAEVLLEIALGGRVSGRVYDKTTGAGIRGVKMRAVPRGFTLSSAPSSQTDSDGRYAMKGLIPGGYQIARDRVEGYGQSLSNEAAVLITAKIEGEMTNVDFALDRGIRIFGKVMDEEGRPLEDAAVDAQSDRGGEYFFGRTKRDGSFVVAGFSPNKSVRVTARKSGFAFVWMEPESKSVSIKGSDVHGVRIVMGVAGSISGVVVDSLGRPSARVQVGAQSTQPNGGNSVERTAADGTFTLDGLSAGTYNFRFYNSGRSMSFVSGPDGSTATVKLPKGEKITGVRLLNPSESVTDLSISGRVTDEQGTPIGSVNIRVDSPSWSSVRTGTNGEYRIAGLGEGSHRMVVTSSGFMNAKPVSVEAGSRNVDFVLKAVATIEGRVVEAATGDPVTTFRVRSTGTGGGNRISTRYQSVQDPEGRFRLNRAAEGSAKVVVQAEGYSDATVDVSGVVSGRTVYDVVVRMESGAKLTGTVVDRSRTPIAFAEIYLGPIPDEWNRSQNVIARTDAEGQFHLTSLPAGSVTLSVSHSEYATVTVDVSLSRYSENSTEIVLSAGGSIEGYVEEGGIPSTNASLSIRTGGEYLRTRTDGEGAYRFAGLSEGQTTVSARIQGARNRSQNQLVDVRDEMTTTIDFIFAPATSSIEGTIYLNADTPLGQQSYVSAQIETGGNITESASVQSGLDGRYVFEALPAGTVRLHVRVTGNMQRSVSLVLGEDESVRQDIYLNGGASVSCEISGIDANFQGIAVLLSGEVVISDFSMETIGMLEQSMVGSAQVENGRALLSGISPGRYTVLAVALDTRNVQDVAEMYADALWQTAFVTVAEDQQEVVRFEL